VRGATWREFHIAELVPAQLGPRLPYLAATCAALLGLPAAARA
jgi:hypothetical protein